MRAGVGAVDASFSYRVMAKRKDIQDARLEEVELPTPRLTELPTPPRREDFTYWATADKKMLRRGLRLIEEARRTPFEGTGKPEPLRRNLSGFWSRRIDDEHRLVYGATDDELIIIQARYHYDG